MDTAQLAKRSMSMTPGGRTSSFMNDGGGDGEGVQSPSQERSPRGSGQTVALNCSVYGEGVHTAMARQKVSFTIQASDANGNRQPSGGDKFLVNLRGSSQVRARVVDKENGEYEVSYKP
jgi:hypothetical protein